MLCVTPAATSPAAIATELTTGLAIAADPGIVSGSGVRIGGALTGTGGGGGGAGEGGVVPVTLCSEGGYTEISTGPYECRLAQRVPFAPGPYSIEVNSPPLAPAPSAPHWAVTPASATTGLTAGEASAITLTVTWILSPGAMKFSFGSALRFQPSSASAQPWTNPYCADAVVQTSG